MTTFGDQLKQFGGVPVASDKFAGWWGNNVWFVDYDNGIRANDEGMNDIKHPQKDLDLAIADASAGDVIYIRPRTSVYRYGSSPEVITPPTATNWVVPKALHHLSIIGTTTGGGLTHGVSLRSYQGLATFTLRFYAQYCTLENIGFHAIAEQINSGCVEAKEDDPGTHEGYALTVNRCNFQVYKSGHGGALVFNSGRYNQCLNSSFWHNEVSIFLSPERKTIQGQFIIGNKFLGTTTDIDCDIVIGNSNHIFIDSNIFDHAIPALSGGLKNKYICTTGTAYGVVSNNYFATGSLGFNDTNSIDGMVDVANKCGHSSVWMSTS